MPVRHIEVVEDEVGEAEHVGDGLEFPAGDGFLENGFVVEGVDFVSTDAVYGGTEEATGAGCRIKHFFTEFWRGHLRHELGDGAWCVVFAFVSGVTEFDENGFVNGAEDVAVVRVIEVKAIELIDDLAHLEAGLHVIVRAVEDLADEGGTLLGFG